MATSLSSSQLMRNDVEMHRQAAITIKRVSGCSKLNSFSPAYCRSEIAWLTKYEQPDMKSIRKRIAKIQTMSLDWISRYSAPAVARLTARVMKAIKATPVTP